MFVIPGHNHGVRKPIASQTKGTNPINRQPASHAPSARESANRGVQRSNSRGRRTDQKYTHPPAPAADITCAVLSEDLGRGTSGSTMIFSLIFAFSLCWY